MSKIEIGTIFKDKRSEFIGDIGVVIKIYNDTVEIKWLTSGKHSTHSNEAVFDYLISHTHYLFNIITKEDVMIEML